MVDFNPVARVTPRFDPVAKVVTPTPQPTFDPVAKVVKPPPAPTPKPAPKPPPKPLQQKRTQDLGQRIRAIEQRVQVIETRREAEAVKDQLADISDAITLTKACLIENFGEDRMAIMETLKNLEQQVASLTATVNEQSAVFTEVQNEMNALSVSTRRAGWTKGVRPLYGSAQDQGGNYWQGRNVDLSAGRYGGANCRVTFSSPSIMQSDAITIHEAYLMIEMDANPDAWGGDTYCMVWDEYVHTLLGNSTRTETWANPAFMDLTSATPYIESAMTQYDDSSEPVVLATYYLPLEGDALAAACRPQSVLYTGLQATTATRSTKLIRGGALSTNTGTLFTGLDGTALQNAYTTRQSMWIEYWYTLNDQAGA